MKNLNEYVNEQITSKSLKKDDFISDNPLLNADNDFDTLDDIIDDLTKNNKKLPSENEFESACKRVVKLNSLSILEFFIDRFKSYLNTDSRLVKGDTSLNLNKIFVLHKVYDYVNQHPDKDDMMGLYNALLKRFFDYWNVDWESIPDYSKGLDILAAAYDRLTK